MLNYRKTFFDPSKLAGFSPVSPVPGAADETPQAREDWAYKTVASESSRADVFVFMEEAVLALNIAMATRRPLLVSGEPGGGKTSLALYTARALGRSFYRQTITSRTQVTDLLSGFDAVARLGDAQLQQRNPKQSYVVPGRLWWALNPETAAQRGAEKLDGIQALADPDPDGSRDSALLLLDEIDKADPDIPNDLLEVLDENKFTVPETGDEIERKRKDLLIVLTTNGERELPPAFMRRCVTLDLPGPPNERWLVDIAERRFPVAAKTAQPAWTALYEKVAREVMIRRDKADSTQRRKPSTSEFIDAVSACRELLRGAPKASPDDLSALLDSLLTKERAVSSEPKRSP
jgi:MoxR-like ATPase